MIWIIRRGYLRQPKDMESSRGSGSFPAARSRREAAEEALVREIREELDTEIEVGALIHTIEYDYPAFHLSMDCFLAKVTAGSLTLKEAQAARWLTGSELYEVPWLPADISLIRILEKRMAGVRAGWSEKGQRCLTFVESRRIWT